MDDIPKVTISRNAIAACPDCGSTMFSRANIYACKRCEQSYVFVKIERTPFGSIPRPADMTQVRQHDLEEAGKIMRGEGRW